MSAPISYHDTLSRDRELLRQERERGMVSTSVAVKDIKELAKSYTAVAIETLVSIARDGDSESARVAAALALLERGWGKNEQGITVTVSSRDEVVGALGELVAAGVIDAARAGEEALALGVIDAVFTTVDGERSDVGRSDVGRSDVGRS